MNAPIIGITTYGRDEKGHFTLPAEYVDAVRRAGGVPLLLPPGEARLEVWIERLDAVILAGGGDLDPELYAGCRHEAIYNVNPERDQSELALARRLVAGAVPTLGVCRGLQVINVALGGTLHEHLPDVVGESVLHRLPPRVPTPHELEVLPGTRLAGILGETRFTASSWHHQAIDEVAPGLEVAARAPDGTIEAVEMPRHRWLVAVQWHPELTAAVEPLQQRVFDALARAAVAAAAEGRERCD